MKSFHGDHERKTTQPWIQGCQGDVKVSSSLLSSCIYSYPYFVEEDLQTPSIPPRSYKEDCIKKTHEKKDFLKLKKVCHNSSSPSSCMTPPKRNDKEAKSATKRFQKEEPSALKKVDRKFYKNVVSESSLKRVLRPMSPCTALSPIKLSHILRSKNKKLTEFRYSLKNKNSTVTPNLNSNLTSSFKPTKKRRSTVENKQFKLESPSETSTSGKCGPLMLKSSKSCGTCDFSDDRARNCTMTIAKITLNEDDKGVFVPFSWLEKFNAEEIRLKLIKKELSKIPQPIGMESKFYKSRQSTLICKIARAGSI